MTRVRADHCTQRLVLGTAIRRRHRTMSAVGHPMAGPNDGTKNRPLRTCDGDIHGGPLTVDPQRRWPRGARRRSADFHRIEPPKLFNSSSENGSPHPRYARHALILSPDRPSRHTGSSRRKGAYIVISVRLRMRCWHPRLCFGQHHEQCWLLRGSPPPWRT